MAAQRKSIDCRDYPSEKNCSLKISGTEEEVLDAATQHAVSAHGHEETPELREQLRSMLGGHHFRQASAFLCVSPVSCRVGHRGLSLNTPRHRAQPA